jgi:hypothetical protein
MSFALYSYTPGQVSTSQYKGVQGSLYDQVLHCMYQKAYKAVHESKIWCIQVCTLLYPVWKQVLGMSCSMNISLNFTNQQKFFSSSTYWYVGICGLVGRTTTFVGGDVGLIPTCCMHPRGVAVDLQVQNRLVG